MLTTGSQIQKATYCIIPTYNILERKTTGESHSVVARGWNEESVDCKETMKGNIGEWWHYFLLWWLHEYAPGKTYRVVGQKVNFTT